MNALARSGRKLDHQLGRPGRGRTGEIRIDAFLPPIRAVGAEAETLGGPPNPCRLEVRGFQQDVGRGVGDLGVLATHDPGQRDRAVGVGDYQIGRVEVAVDAVQRSHLLTRARAAHDDLPVGELCQVEGVQRVAETDHHVVGDVDDAGDRPHAGSVQPRAQPER
jgi:hypothetical protein